MLALVFSSALLAVLHGVTAVQHGGSHKCRCLPSQPCWPSQHEWSALNQSLGGNLDMVVPVGQACHEPNFNQAMCAEINGMATNSSWRSGQPGVLSGLICHGPGKFP